MEDAAVEARAAWRGMTDINWGAVEEGPESEVADEVDVEGAEETGAGVTLEAIV